jgi:hypothetical protein
VPVLEIGRKLFAVLSAASAVGWLVVVVTSKHHHAITFWLVIAEGFLALAFCTAWLDERATARRLQAQAVVPFEAWLQQRIDAAALIRRERRVHDDTWFIGATGDWDTTNVTEMGLGDQPLAPDLVDSYRRRDPETNVPGIPPPYGVAEHERQFEQGVAWLRDTLDGLQGKRRFRRLAAAWLARRRAAWRVSRGSSGPRGAGPGSGPGRGEGGGTTRA